MGINFLAVIFYASVYLFSTQLISNSGDSHALLEKLTAVPYKPSFIFISSVTFFFTLMGVICYRDYLKSQKLSEFWDKWVVFELLTTIGLLISLHFSYNGFLLLVFADVFYHSKDLYTLLDKRYWLVFLFLSFGLLLLTDVNVISSIMPLPAVDTYLSFLPFY